MDDELQVLACRSRESIANAGNKPAEENSGRTVDTLSQPVKSDQHYELKGDESPDVHGIQVLNEGPGSRSSDNRRQVPSGEVFSAKSMPNAVPVSSGQQLE